MPRFTPYSQKHMLYYQAIIQLRPDTPEVLQFVEKEIADSRKVFVSRMKKVKNGLDLYISSNQCALSIGKKFRKRFRKGIVKTSRSLYSQDKQTSKKIYRVTVLLKQEDI